MTTAIKKSLLETIKPAFASGNNKDEIILKITMAIATKSVKDPFVFTTKAVEQAYYSIADKLGYILNRESLQSKVTDEMSKLEKLPVYYSGVLVMIKRILGDSLNTDEDILPILKENWKGDFPKVVIFGYRENTMLRQGYDFLSENPQGQEGFIEKMQGLLKWDGDISKPATSARISNNIKVITDHLYENQLLVEKLGIDDYLKLNK